MSDPYQRYMPTGEMIDRQNMQSTAQATAESRRLIDRLVEHSLATAEAAEIRERQMLRWTQAGVVLAAIAAVASIIAVVLGLV